MTKRKSERRTVEVAIDCDTSRLYGPLADAIAYLQEVLAAHPEAAGLSLDEHWTGYEDMEMRFVYARPETDEEYERRLQLEREEAQHRAAEARRATLRAEKQKAIAKLQADLRRLS